MEVTDLSSTEVLICMCELLPPLPLILLRSGLKRANNEEAFHPDSLKIPAKTFRSV